ncbi:hypothetical protein PT7_2506 [Pusillimonas sp. T7-7]|nr:hypothetical protein PT7_2506 [Pusillimonas sp. T7-7]
METLRPKDSVPIGPQAVIDNQPDPNAGSGNHFRKAKSP